MRSEGVMNSFKIKIKESYSHSPVTHKDITAEQLEKTNFLHFKVGLFIDWLHLWNDSKLEKWLC